MSLARALAGASMIGSNEPAPRREHDFYATADAEVTRALLGSPAGYRLRAYGRVRESACGDGAMARVLEDGGLEVVASDVMERGIGFKQDFVSDGTAGGCRALVTNPPFTLYYRDGAQVANAPTKEQREADKALGVKHSSKNGQVAFLRRANTLGFELVCLFAKSQFWHASTRLPLWDHWRPAMVLPLTWRPDFTGQGAPTMDCMWIVWDRAHTGATAYEPLRRPS